MAKHNYKFYMQKVDIDGNAINESTIKDLEKDFVGLKYSQAKGINNVGKQRVYTENIVENERSEVYIPESPSYETTTIDLTLFFIDTNKNGVNKSRYETYNEFNDYVRVGFHKYWDTARNRSFTFYIEDEIKIDEELWYGSTPYLKVTYRLQNVKGITEKQS